MRRSPAWKVVAVPLAVLACLVAAEALGCPNCKDGVNTTDPDGLNVARGYFYSILFMLAMPFTLAGSFGAYVWREMRRQRRHAAGNAGPAADPAAELSAAAERPAGAAGERTLP